MGIMTPQADQLVLNYLNDVGQATYEYLTVRGRSAYLAELRARIDTECGDSADAERVRQVLASFGTPEELVARECVEDDEDDEDDTATESVASDDNRPRHANREPPPWRGGPDRGLFSGVRGTAVRGTADAPRGAIVGLATAVRSHPPEIFAIGVYLVSGVFGQVALVWAVGAVLVILSDVWPRGDKWVGVAVPLVATLLGMALWPGEAPYVDQIILMSLMDTGVIGLRLAALGCGVYLLVRITRHARAAGT